MLILRKPLPDEFLYSAVARAVVLNGIWSPKRVLDFVFGVRTVTAVPDLPTNLAAVAESTYASWQLTAAELALRHTLFGYYTHFLGQERSHAVLLQMVGVGSKLQVRLGICSGAARAPKRFRLCLRCHALDIATHGEPFWHRAHHMPGVLVCHVHGDVLVECELPFRPVGRHEFQPAPVDLTQHRLQPLVDGALRLDLARSVAIRSVEILNGQPYSSPVVPDYRQALADRGYSDGRGAAKRLQEAFIAYFGEELLQASLRPRTGAVVAWLTEVLRGPRRPMHPFKHVLMGLFLEGQPRLAGERELGEAPRAKTWGLYRVQQVRDEAASLARFGLTTHAVATALEVHWKTAKRLLTPMSPVQPVQLRDAMVDRQAWRTVAEAHPLAGKKTLRVLAPALYARLYRNDRAWLLEWRPAQAPALTSVRQIDWPQRDLELERLVRQGVASILRAIPPRRATRSRVLGALGLRAMMAHRAALLPRTQAALEEMCEPVSDFQLRRVTQVLMESGDTLPAWRVLRQAGIRADLLGQGRDELLHRARVAAAQWRRPGSAS